MKKTRILEFFGISASICLVFATILILLAPISALADTCTAQCAGGKSVTCTSSSGCAATDYVGCSELGPGGATKSCKSEESEEEENM
jgi:hypothetical protein